MQQLKISSQPLVVNLVPLGLQACTKTIYIPFCKYPNSFCGYISHMNVDANCYGMAYIHSGQVLNMKKLESFFVI